MARFLEECIAALRRVAEATKTGDTAGIAGIPISRRHFIKTTGVVGAGIASGDPMALAEVAANTAVATVSATPKPVRERWVINLCALLEAGRDNAVLDVLGIQKLRSPFSPEVIRQWPDITPEELQAALERLDQRGVTDADVSCFAKIAPDELGLTEAVIRAALQEQMVIIRAAYSSMMRGETVSQPEQQSDQLPAQEAEPAPRRDNEFALRLEHPIVQEMKIYGITAKRDAANGSLLFSPPPLSAPFVDYHHHGDGASQGTQLDKTIEQAKIMRRFTAGVTDIYLGLRVQPVAGASLYIPKPPPTLIEALESSGMLITELSSAAPDRHLLSSSRP